MGAKDNTEEREDRSSDMERDAKLSESDIEPGRDSLSSQGEPQINEDAKVKRDSRVPKKVAKKETKENSSRGLKGSINRQAFSNPQHKTPTTTPNRAQKSNKGPSVAKVPESKRAESIKVPSRPSSEISEDNDDKAFEDAKEMDVLDEAPNCDQSVGTDDEIADNEGNAVDEESAIAYAITKELELKVEMLEQELREVAALEISLYSVVLEHGSSAHKVHTPARRLSRLYIHACKFWSPEKKATFAKNTISGLVLIAKSCGNEVPRLTYWLSNTVVLREIISQTFGISSQLSPLMKALKTNGSESKLDGRPMPTRWKASSNGKQVKNVGVVQLADDWQDTSTFTAALEKIESWVFSRIVESVWWQAMTPHMQTPDESSSLKAFGRVSGPSLGDQQQGIFSINLWKSAFQDSSSRLCPLRAGGHECGCLPVLAKLVMEQCIARLDVAMFNAILRESESEMPTDPVSDPIVDSKVLPIPAGDLSFGSGAQLKNAIGNWSRWLTDMFGMDADEHDTDDQDLNGDKHTGGKSESKSFRLLNELSDLLMLPKDMLLDKSVRKEVCPSVGLPLVTRILCNFTPDEFCPDTVPSIVLEELNSESIMERITNKEVISTFPCMAASVVYCRPSPSDVAEKVADSGGKSELDRRASVIQRRGYTSDDDLDDLDSPLASLFDRTAPTSPANGVTIGARKESSMANRRYELLREAWSERP